MSSAEVGNDKPHEEGQNFEVRSPSGKDNDVEQCDMGKDADTDGDQADRVSESEAKSSRKRSQPSSEDEENVQESDRKNDVNEDEDISNPAKKHKMSPENAQEPEEDLSLKLSDNAVDSAENNTAKNDNDEDDEGEAADEDRQEEEEEDVDGDVEEDVEEDMEEGGQEEHQDGNMDEDEVMQTSDQEHVEGEDNPALPPRPKRPKSSYFQFLDSKRQSVSENDLPEGCTKISDVTKYFASQWRAMTDEEKQPFVDLAAKEKETYDHDLKAYIEAGGSMEVNKSASGSANDSCALQLPLSVISRIVRRDNDVKRASKDAATAIAKATELFLEYAAMQTFRNVEPKRKTIAFRHFRKAIVKGPEALEFLAPDFPKPVHTLSSSSSSSKAHNASSNRVQVPKPPVTDHSQKSISQFFQAKK